MSKQETSSPKEQLLHAPVAEAIIEIRAELPPGIEPTDLERLQEEIKASYPIKKAIRNVESTTEFKEDPKPPSITAKDMGVVGFIFWSKDQKQAVQYRLDGFTFSRLKPYTGWETIKPEAKRLWEIFLKVIRPLQVTRLAVRFINVIEIHELHYDLEDYLAEPPRIPEGLPQTVDHFYSRILIDLQEIESKALVTQTNLRRTKEDLTPILLDIDVFREGPRNPDDPLIWEILDKFRPYRNKIFDKSITEKAKRLFQ